jgi:hypothetical protein
MFVLVLPDEKSPEAESPGAVTFTEMEIYSKGGGDDLREGNCLSPSGLSRTQRDYTRIESPKFK